MNNPLSDQYSKNEDQELVKASLNGSRTALDKLIKIHQPFIYNVAWKMAHDPNDAKDLTQETLVKVITKLSQFNFKSSFRTWLYRIVTNEFLQSKRRSREKQFTSFDEYGVQLDAVPNPDLNKEEELIFADLSKEMQTKCMSGMLMCLNREQRLIYILGDSFGIDHNIGADIFEISPQNFRVKLHRARKDLYSYMNDKCGLVNKSNPCRCPKKAKALNELGMLTEENMEFNKGFKKSISEYVQENHEDALEEFEELYTNLFRQHPVKDDFDKETILETILKEDGLISYFNK